jgi:hypothetical protein
MLHPRAAVARNQNNVFVANPKAVAFLKSLGWRAAKLVDIGAKAEVMDERILTSLAKGPVVVSTAFGTSSWGETGGGHMIAIVAADQRGNFIVEDPAGNWFATHKGGYSDTAHGHYGPGSCGHRALYPHYWLLAYTTGRYLVELGRRTRPTSPRTTSGLALAGVGSAAAIPHLMKSSSSAPKFGSAISIYDARPGGRDAPLSFYLQDAAGRQAGWIDGRVVSEIPYASVGQDTLGSTDPAVGDQSIAPWPGSTPASPRALVVPDLAPGTRLFVTATKGTRFALTVEAWRDGEVIAKDAATGTGTGKPARVTSRPLTALR